jgi:hypothetical protein
MHKELLSYLKKSSSNRNLDPENKIPGRGVKVERPETTSLRSLDGSRKPAFAFVSVSLALLDLGARRLIFQAVAGCVRVERRRLAPARVRRAVTIRT